MAGLILSSDGLPALFDPDQDGDVVLGKKGDTTEALEEKHEEAESIGLAS